jgi:predicted cytidylate kinase
MKKNMNKISLSGLVGSGKSTIGKQLAQILNYEFISVGNFSRKIAREKYGMNINEFQKYCEKNPQIDHEIDNHFAKYCSQNSDLIIDYRLAYYFIPDCFHVFLRVSEEVAHKRLKNAKDAQRNQEFDNQKNMYEVMKKRNEDMKNRFLKTYQTDFTDESHYHLVIDTDHLNPNQICDLILKKFGNL